MKNPYSVLGIPTTATLGEIRATYFALARQEHPDLKGNSAEANARMAAIIEAYTALKTPEARAKVDAELGARPPSVPGDSKVGMEEATAVIVENFVLCVRQSIDARTDLERADATRNLWRASLGVSLVAGHRACEALLARRKATPPPPPAPPKRRRRKTATTRTRKGVARA